MDQYGAIRPAAIIQFPESRICNGSSSSSFITSLKQKSPVEMLNTHLLPSGPHLQEQDKGTLDLKAQVEEEDCTAVLIPPTSEYWRI